MLRRRRLNRKGEGWEEEGRRMGRTGGREGKSGREEVGEGGGGGGERKEVGE